LPAERAGPARISLEPGDACQVGEQTSHTVALAQFLSNLQRLLVETTRRRQVSLFPYPTGKGGQRDGNAFAEAERASQREALFSQRASRREVTPIAGEN